MKEKKNYWMIDGCDTKFDTLRDAKNHTTFWTPKELEQYDGRQIARYKDEEIVSTCTMYADGVKARFTKTWKVIPNHVW